MVIKIFDNIKFIIVSEEYKNDIENITSFLFNECNDLYNLLSELGIKYKKINNLEIIIRDKIYGISYDGGAFENKIILFGFNYKTGVFTHELIHLLFPSNNLYCSEGFSDYISSYKYGEIHPYWENIPSKNIILIHLKNKYSCKYDNVFQLLRNNKIIKDLKLSRIPFFQSINLLFVNYLIKNIGIDNYLDNFHNNDKIDNLKEEKMFCVFWNELENNDIDLDCEKYNEYFIKENEYYEIWENIYRKYDLNIDEDIISYYWDNECYFNEKEKDEIFTMYKKELSLFNYPLNKDKWML